ncbi:hypothetical protein RB195_024936 [Necator americanus]|uniref:Uncharacterized protein n=1 Tax=Necator americanus TaxID=51031 RepID=A0ABR1EQA7_NECAM
MPVRSTRVTKKQAALSSQSNPRGETSTAECSQTIETNYNELSAAELISAIAERNKDPVISKMLAALSEKVRMDFAEQFEADKRSRSVVISGLPDSGSSERLDNLEEKVNDILLALNVSCRPVDLYRMGKPNASHPRLVKVVFPSQFYWRRALANARLLRGAGFPNVYIRRSMTPDERKREYELRQEARERNRGKSQREWVVYRGELRHISDIKRNTSGNA